MSAQLIAYYMAKLDMLRDHLADNLVTKGVSASNSEPFDDLVPKVLNIQTGGGPIEPPEFVCELSISNVAITDI